MISLKAKQDWIFLGEAKKNLQVKIKKGKTMIVIVIEIPVFFWNG